MSDEMCNDATLGGGHAGAGSLMKRVRRSPEEGVMSWRVKGGYLNRWTKLKTLLNAMA